MEQLLGHYGIRVWPTVAVASADEAVAAAAELGYPVVLKSTSPLIRHQVGASGVRVDLASETSVREAFAALCGRLAPLAANSFVVQRMAEPGVPCVINTTEDPLFGPVVSFSVAGPPTELLGDVGHRIPPLTDVDVSDLISSVRAAPLLHGHRGAAPVNRGALSDLIARRRGAGRRDPRGGVPGPQPGQRPPGRGGRPRGRGGRRPGLRAQGHRSPGAAVVRKDGGMGTTSDDTTTAQSRPLPAGLTRDIERAGYYPALVSDVVSSAVAGDDVVSHLVHQETTFDHDTVRRHITVLALTTSRLVIAHADDHAGDHEEPTTDAAVATATTESVPLSSVRGVMLTHVVTDPAAYRPGSLGRELTLTIGWGAVSRLDLVPATCGDTGCEADHGYEGTVTADDIGLRISADADGEAALGQAMTFARELSATIGR